MPKLENQSGNFEIWLLGNRQIILENAKNFNMRYQNYPYNNGFLPSNLTSFCCQLTKGLP